MFPYIDDQEDEITIKDGEIVAMKREHNGWWLVCLNIGLVIMTA